jgi:large subunit ribosomal protein L16
MKEFPKNFSYGRCFRFKLNDKMFSSFNKLNLYRFGIKALESGWVTNSQLKSILRLIRIFLKRKVSLKMNISFIVPISKKPLETRMGSGKGERKFWRCPVKKGMILFEIDDITDDEMNFIYFLISNRLKFLTKISKMNY